MSDVTPRAVLGGTFDPVHYGHLRCAWEVAEWLQCQVGLLPSKLPVHKETPGGSAEHRWNMLQLATSGYDRLYVDRTELDRQTASYTVNTLEAFRVSNPKQPLIFIVGADAFAGFCSWKSWQSIPDLAHLVVLSRPGVQQALPDELSAVVDRRRTDDTCELLDQPAGRIAFKPVTPLDISASDIRAELKARRTPSFLMPQPVIDYIRQHELYAK